MPDLASLLAGNDPLGPQMVPGYVGAQLMQQGATPTTGPAESSPFAALARTIAGFAGPAQLQNSVNAVTAARQAANPELLSALTNTGGPLRYAAQNPGMSNVALSHLLALPPDALQSYYEANRLGRAGEAQANAAPAPTTPATEASPIVGWGKLNSGAPAQPAAAPAAKPVIPESYTGRQAQPSSDISGILDMPPAQQAAAVGKFTPAQKAELAKLIAQMRSKGGAGAVKP